MGRTEKAIKSHAIVVPSSKCGLITKRVCRLNHPILLGITLIRAMTEVALLALAGQAALFLFAGSGRDGNPVYQLFRIVTRPVIRLARRLLPRRVIDRHLPFAAFLALFCAWVGLAFLKRVYCLANQLQCV